MTNPIKISTVVITYPSGEPDVCTYREWLDVDQYVSELQVDGPMQPGSTLYIKHQHLYSDHAINEMSVEVKF